MVSFKWFTIAWTCSSSRFKAVCIISSCEVLLVLVIPALNTSTGMHATREVQDSLLSAVNEGEKKCRNFVNSALS
jgi:hypothetical protein